MNFFQLRESTVIFLLLFAGCQAAATNDDRNGDDAANPALSDYRLPKTIVPIGYEIMLSPELENNFEFTGVTHIKAIVREATDTITLHHGKLNILKCSVTTQNETKVILSLIYNSNTEKYEIKLQETLKVGLHISINFNYTGKLRDDMIGFYRTSYVDSNRKIRWLASTQFQTKHARHAFPCFDEPSFKATFIVRISRKKEYACLSNMPLNRTTDAGQGEYWDEFEQSIPMSTYLVAFIVSDFDDIGSGSFKVWARPNAIQQAKYALSVGPQALTYLSKLFQQEYQLYKMDMVAVPDFSAGAMENWGLVTYRESRLLYDEISSSDAAQQSVASVIVHELTHMWFGNMITPEWWSYLWLSEAFARYFQYFATAQIEKSWNMEEQFVVEQHQTALAADGLETSMPMTRNVSNSEQLGGIGDTITYNKGASIVRMMNLTFGRDIFKAGLQNYLENNRNNGVARPENLWQELQNEVNRRNQKLAAPVNEIMSTWTTQAGFPVVTVSIENGVATMKQKRFLLRNLKATPTNAKWWIPITWARKDNSSFDVANVGHWLSKEQDSINLGTSPGWVIMNVQSAGFYRVNYDNASWYRIIDVLNSENYEDIHVLNRAALVDDLLNLARAGLLNYETALDGLQYIRRETKYLPFKSALSGLTYLDQRFRGHDEYYAVFQKFVLALIDETYKQIGYLDRPNDDRMTVLLRSELNKWACNYGHDGCVTTFTTLFRKWKADNSSPIKPNQRPAAYCAAVKNGTKDDWDFLWIQYVYSNFASEQAVILQALGCTKDVSILETFLLHALESFEKGKIRKQDNGAAFSAVYSSGISGAEFVLNFVAKHYPEMMEYSNGTSTISSILKSASQHFSTQELVDQFESLIETRRTEFKDILDSLRDSLEIAKYELLWLEKFKDPIRSWITAFNDRESSGTTPGENDTTNYRLPANINPTSYWINLKPHFDESSDFPFEGQVRINAEVTKGTKYIVLHSSGLRIDTVYILRGMVPLTIANMSIDEKYDFFTIELDQDLQLRDIVTIKIHYTGNLNEEMRGFYRSSYKDNDGKTRWLAATHLEPVAARKVFPCFDEPALKATFIIEATVQPGYSAISNMLIQRTVREANGEKTIMFQETPIMSTYLVALVVSDFASLAHGTYSVWARPNAISQAYYAMSVMEPLVKFYEKALNFPYQLSKLEMVALPDFASGAMENWGLLTYKERNLLFDGNVSDIVAKQSITNVISHEITHQWFGDLVSPLWWKYLWLNEGFARYFQYFGTANVKENWSLESQFLVDQLHSALAADSLPSSHAMTHDVYSPKEIRAIFDSISYAKGASVIRMVEKSLGRDIFYEALQNYLNKLQYGVATPEDLFNAFKEAITDTETRNAIHDIMNTWTTQPGYPVVHVAVKNNRLHLRQERFLINQKKGVSIESTWHVPITWAPVGTTDFTNTRPRYWLKDANSSIEFPDSDKDLIIFNVQQSGFYRTNYEVPVWKEIMYFLKTSQYKQIPEFNRAALIDDLMNFGRTGYVDYDIVLSATIYLVQETDYGPWRAFFNGLNYLRRHVQGTDVADAYKRYLVGILTPIYDSLKFRDQENDEHITKMLRMHIRKWACEMGVSDCKLQALGFFSTLLNSSLEGLQEFPPNYRSVSYCTIARAHPHSYWKTLWNTYSQATVATEKSVILQSLACTTEKVYLNELLQKAVTKDSGIRFEDSSSVFSSVIEANLEGVECVMDFIKNNYSEMLTYYDDVSKIGSMVHALANRLSTDDLYTKYIDLINWLSEKDISIQSYKTEADTELKWTETHIPKIHEWLGTHYAEEDYRLPSLFSPLKYNVSLSPHFEDEDFTFDGNVQIQMTRLKSRISRIVLHAHELEIKGVRVYEVNSDLTKGKELEVSSYITNKVTETLTIFMKAFVKSDRVIVDIDFTGDLNEKLQGFYRSYYLDSEGNIRWLATTQFEPTHARRAFPCFDEPAYKARFTINIERPDDYVALSNMPSQTSSPSSAKGRTWETFQETVEMPSYLVAFVVSDFKTAGKSNEKVNVWGRPDITLNGELAEIAGIRMLEYLSQETGHNYALPKLDLIGIPDFSMGAMENWGLATFREYGLFYDRNVTTAKYEEYIFTIIAHELAHMWYGNLVTCQWWEYIWLNEGFAEYMQWRIADLFRPSYGFSDLFVVHELQPAMQNDDYRSTHPMNNPVASPAEIAKIFDSITYGKSSSVIRMIRNSMDPEVFTKATHRYLQQHQYSSTTPKDLWKSFDDVIAETNALGAWNISMETLMDSWTNERGYPIVQTVLNNNRLRLTQERFSFNADYEAGKVAFWIPITIASASNPNFATTSTNVWLGGGPLNIHIEKPSEWFLLNVQQSGYYRVNYERATWFLLFDALNEKAHSQIHVTNRAQIIDDLLNLARGGYIGYEIALNGTMYLLAEEEYPPWKAFFNGISFIAQRYEGQESRDVLGKYIVLLTSKMFSKLDFADSSEEKHLDQLSRELILTWTCKYNQTECVDTSKKLFSKWRKNRSDVISPNARAAVYCTALRHGSQDDWQFLWERYLETNFASEKKIILDALGCSLDPKILNQYIQYALTSNYTSDIRKQDVSAALASIYSAGYTGLDVMLNFLLNDYLKVYEFYGEWESVGQLFSKVASHFSTKAHIEKFKEFMAAKKDSVSNIFSTLVSSLENAERHYRWYDKHSKNINAIFTEYTKVKSSGTIAHSLSMIAVTVLSIIVYMVSQ
ncbi:uncharacterized protein LOC143372620 isoform X2 [Andrena cerasifolii]|uniref:uncharacterized protein LOC143372620 isoform X2 n=1 Tax=Andrena cerasifolii TaxID=2819439 RepID=UPI00403807DF